jgi:MHS family proline/betaine transporter-like MFS transporter
MRGTKLRTIIGAVIGNALEWYDFSLYALFATILQSHFFAKGSQPFVAVFGVFAVGYLMRPLGGMLIGHIGDKYSRKTALILTIFVMGLSTALIGILPSYATAGMMAAFFLVLLRMIQGMAIGGEFPGSMVILTEMAGPKHRGFLGSVGLSIGLLGMILADGVANLLSSTLSPSQLFDWGWRIAFLLGLALAGVGLYLRFKVFSENKVNKSEMVHIPLIELMHHHKGTIIRTVLSMTAAGVYTGILTLFLVSYVTHYQHMDMKLAFKLSLSMVIVSVFLFPLGAWLADKWQNFRRWLIVGNIVIALATYPLFLWMQQGTVECFFAFLILAIVFSIGTGPIAAFLVLQFPETIRYSGFAISHGLTFSIIAGTSPLILNWLSYSYGPVAPCFYGIFACLITVIALNRSKK